MKIRLSMFLALVVALATTVVVSVPAAGAAPPRATISNTISGTTASGSSLTGTLSNLQFVHNQGQLSLTGVLNGTLTTATGVVQQIVNQPVTLPVSGAAASGGCTILNLTLGPLHLNLLGLVVDLNQVNLNITGQTGDGRLLGNLLCGLSNALNGNGGGHANLLNRLLGL